MTTLKKKTRVFTKWSKLDLKLKRLILMTFSEGIRHKTQSVFKENEGIVDVFIFETHNTKYFITIPENLKNRKKISLNNSLGINVNYGIEYLSYTDFVKRNR